MFPYEPSEDDWTYVTDYMPSARAVLEELVPNYVKGILYGAMTEAFAAEQNARMMAMDNATKNAGEIAKDLALQYNRVRQAAITTEITEVVSGANAQRN
jgi:F-type H+-transporting ATPase subunit gamma